MRERRKRERERERERENTPPVTARTAPRHLVSDTRPRRRRRGVSDTHNAAETKHLVHGSASGAATSVLLARSRTGPDA